MHERFGHGLGSCGAIVALLASAERAPYRRQPSDFFYPAKPHSHTCITIVILELVHAPQSHTATQPHSLIFYPFTEFGLQQKSATFVERTHAPNRRQPSDFFYLDTRPPFWPQERPKGPNPWPKR
jgi:hypothetical protein